MPALHYFARMPLATAPRTREAINNKEGWEPVTDTFWRIDLPDSEFFINSVRLVVRDTLEQSRIPSLRIGKHVERVLGQICGTMYLLQPEGFFSGPYEELSTLQIANTTNYVLSAFNSPYRLAKDVTTGE